MTSASPMSGMPNDGTKPRSTAISRRRDCAITYRRGGKKLAVATIHRDLDGLRNEVELERVIATGRETLAGGAETPPRR